MVVNKVTLQPRKVVENTLSVIYSYNIRHSISLRGFRVGTFDDLILLSNLALKGLLASVHSIFLTKSHFGFTKLCPSHLRD